MGYCDGMEFKGGRSEVRKLVEGKAPFGREQETSATSSACGSGCMGEGTCCGESCWGDVLDGVIQVSVRARKSRDCREA